MERSSEDASGAARPVPSRRLLQWLSVAALAPWLVLPLVVMVRRVVGHVPSGDLALLELGVHDALAGDQLLGPYSRHGFRHPGPLLFYLLAVPYRLAGGTDFGVLTVAAALINAGCLVALTHLWLRPGGAGAPLAKPWIAAVLATLAAYLAPAVLSSPWAPNLTVIPLVLALSAFAAAAAGRVGWLVVAVLAGSFCVQSHVSHLLGVGAVGAAAVVVVLARRQTIGLRPVRRALAVSAVVGAGVWLPPLLEQASRRPGNLAAMWRFAGARSYDADVGAALLAVGERLAAVPLALIGHTSGAPFERATGPASSGFVTLLASAGAVALGGALVARVRGHAGRTADLRHWAAGAALLAGAAAVGWGLLVEPPIEPYLVRWSSAAGVLGLLAMAPPWGGSRLGSSRWLALGLAGALLLLAARGAVAVARFDPAAEAAATARVHRARAVARAAVAAAREAGADRVAVRFREPRAFQQASTVAARLVESGHSLAIDPVHRYLFGERPVVGAGDLQLWIGRASSVVNRADMVGLWRGDGMVLARFEPQPLDRGGLALGRPVAEPYLLEGFGATQPRGDLVLRSLRGQRARLLVAFADPVPAAICLAAQASPAGGGPQTVGLRVDGRRVGELSYRAGQLVRRCTSLPSAFDAGVHELALEPAPVGTARRGEGRRRALLLLHRLSAR